MLLFYLGKRHLMSSAVRHKDLPTGRLTVRGVVSVKGIPVIRL